MVIRIHGMRSNACRERIVAALEAVEGVSQADVNLYRGVATVEFLPPCRSVDVVRAIADAGYEAESL